MGKQSKATGTRALYEKQQTQRDPGFQAFPFISAYYLFISFVACRWKGLRLEKNVWKKFTWKNYMTRTRGKITTIGFLKLGHLSPWREYQGWSLESTLLFQEKQ